MAVTEEWEDAATDPLVQALREDLEEQTEILHDGETEEETAPGPVIEAARRLGGELTLRIRRDVIASAASLLKEKHGFVLLADLGAGDGEVVYHLSDAAAGRRLRLKVAAGQDAAVPTVSGVWRGAAGPERAAFDSHGIRFEGLPEEGSAGEVELAFGASPEGAAGQLRLRLRFDGDRIADCHPEIAPLPRNLRAQIPSLAWCGAVEKLCGLEVPPRARFVRTALAELERIASHLQWLATHAEDVGATAPAPSCRAERQQVLGLLLGDECPGGLAADLPDLWAAGCRDFLETFPARVDDWEGMLTENRLWKRRTVGVGVLPPEVALDCGVTGPALRASGVPRDLRKAHPYEAYGEVDFEVPVCRNGDTYDRYRVRIEEMRWSARIVEQCLDRLPGGAVHGPRPYPPARRGVEIYHAVEGPRGETGFYLIGDGSADPGPCGWLRPPSPYNLQALPEIARGQTLADVVALVGTLDLDLGERLGQAAR